jgi:hypothetical protein
LVNFMAIWNILWTFWIFHDHLVHFVFVWYIFTVWVSCNKRNLATLVVRQATESKPKRAGKKWTAFVEWLLSISISG